MGFRNFAGALAKSAAIVVCAAVPALAQAGIVKFEEYSQPGAGITLYGSGADAGIKFSASGDAGSFSTAATNASSLNNGTANITLYNTGAGAQSTGSQKFFYVAGGLLVAEFDFDYLGDYHGETNVQRVTYNNYFGQGITDIIAPTSGGNIVQGTYPPAYLGQQIFFDGPNWNTEFISTEVIGFRVYTSNLQAALAANNVPEPGSLALFGLAIAGLSMVSRRRKS